MFPGNTVVVMKGFGPGQEDLLIGLLCVVKTVSGGTLTVMCASFPGPTPSERVPHPQAVDGPLSQSNTASGLDDFDEEGLPPMGGQDFGSMIRDKILGEHNKKESLTEFEVRGQQRPTPLALDREYIAARYDF